MLGQQEGVGAAGAKRRQLDLDHVDAKEEVFAEPPLLDGGLQVAVGGGEDSRVEGHFPFAAHRPHLVFLQRPQQLRLHGQGHFADFVQEQRPSFRLKEEPFAIDPGVGERALDVSEQFAFQEGVRQSGGN